jgi:hypothetical protein
MSSEKARMCIGTALGVLLLACSGLAGTKPRDTSEETLALAAWRVAARVSSPIDAGNERVRIASQMGDVGQTNVLETWTRERGESWIRSGVCAHLASAITLNGDGKRAGKWLAEASLDYERATEWRRPLVAQALNRALASMILLPAPTNRVATAVHRLAAWVEESPAERPEAAAWACAVRMARTTNEGDQDLLIDEALRLIPKLLPWEQLRLMARLVPSMRSENQRSDCLMRVEERTGGLTNALSSAAAFEVAVRAAQVCYALGKRAKGDALLTKAAAYVEHAQAGDECAPWVLLAEGYHSADKPEAVKAALLAGLPLCKKQPGFYQDVSLARTLSAMAVSGCAWTAEEISQALNAAK